MSKNKVWVGFVLGSAIAGCGGSPDNGSAVGSEADWLNGGACSVPQNILSITGHTTPPLPTSLPAAGSGALQLPEIPKEARLAEGPGVAPDGAKSAGATATASTTSDEP